MTLLFRCASRAASIAICFALLTPLHAGEAAADWQRVLDLDAGPKASPTTQQQAKAAALAHLAEQEKALRAFLQAHASDPRAFEANIRLARLLQIRAGMENAEPLREQARRILDQLEKTASGEQRQELAFARITFQMRAMRASTAGEREQLLRAVRRFQAEYPRDRRLAHLLAEIANVFDAEPDTKRALLVQAQGLTADPALQRRIGDDLKRLGLLGKPVALRFTTIQGKEVSVEESRGKVVLLIFFADFSPPSIEAIARLQRTTRDLPKDRVQLLGVSLDNKMEDVAAVINKHGITWPVGFDGKGWAGPAVRTVGINALPTVWLIDQAGQLRSLNALENATDQISQLLRNPPPLK